MIFSNKPQILVIDDNLKEIQPLLQVFSQNGISYVYFDGKEETHPDPLFTSIRFIILDVDIDGITSGLDDKSKASALASYLSQIIDLNTSPYAILFWTKRKEVITHFIDYLKLDNSCPVFFKDMEKPAAKDITLDYVKEKFLSELEDEAFEFLIKWEESITNDASSFTNKISNIAKMEAIKNESSWQESIKKILTKFACAYTGEKSINDNSIAINYATNILNTALSESFSSDIKLENNIKLPQNCSLSFETISDLNQILFFEKLLDSKKIDNGKVFHIPNDDLLNILKIDKTIKKFLPFGTSSLISIILTPSCDIAHHKNLRIINEEDTNKTDLEIHRIVYGVQIEIEPANYTNPDFQVLLKSINSFPDNIFFIRPFTNIENTKRSIIIFHFDTVTYYEVKPNEIQFDYMLKQNLVYDLQSKLANHVNRLGNSMLEFY